MSLCRSATRNGVATSVKRLRSFHSTSQRWKLSNLAMPAMSPTMTEGGIANWKVKEGAKFAVGDVLLEIETDKATIDVEAQDEGVMAKIIASDGMKNIPVGKTIAVLAEEGDDISNVQVPEEAEPESKTAGASKDASQPDKPLTDTKTPSNMTSDSSPKKKEAQGHSIKLDLSKPMFPSVILLLEENGLSPDKVKGTGRRGMLTKGDVLAYLGKASSPTGTWKNVAESPIPKRESTSAKPKAEVLDAPTLRRLVVEGLSDMSKRRQVSSPLTSATFETLLEGYRLQSSPSVPPITPPPEKPRGYLDGLI